MKVLWFCNAEFSELKSAGTGTWLHSMANALVNSGEVLLYNITQGKVKHITRHDHQSITQWLVPVQSLTKFGLPRSKTIYEIQQIVNEVKPDVIHIWGTESYWGLLTARGYLKGNVILEIQGLKFVIEKYIYSGLSSLDIFRCFGLKELLKPSVSLPGVKSSFRQWGKFEKEMLMKHHIISTQSNWVRAYVKNLNPFAQVFNTTILLRNDFLEANKWEMESCVPYQIFTSTSSSISYKGLHILFDAVAILKLRFPKIRLCIAGSIKSGIRQDGYSKWLQRKAKKLGILENIFWLGSLNAKDIVKQMFNANVAVVPSFVESYCLALEEALMVGVPTVVSFAGAMPELAVHEKTALFFPPGDAAMCANVIEKFFVDKEYAKNISHNAYDAKSIKKEWNIAHQQLSIYTNILSSNCN